ncbi:MAG: hypothetical protein ACRDZO_04680 [Egibacteraceae bacterium]
MPARNVPPPRLILEPSSTGSPSRQPASPWPFALAVVLAMAGGAVMQGRRAEDQHPAGS